MNKFTTIKKLYTILSLFIFSSSLIAENIIDKREFDIKSISFSSSEFSKEYLDEESYINFIKDHIFVQPEYKFASAIQNEKRLLLRSANRERLPTISGRVINDEVIDRKINDFSSIRKRQDDSFDAVAEINQPLYQGGKINSEIKFARHQSNNSVIEKKLTTSNLILEANSIFVQAMIYDYIYKYALSLLDNLMPFKEKMKNRVTSGAIDPAQYALFLARLNTFQSSIYTLEAKAKTNSTNFENIFNQKFIFLGFPKIPIIIEDNFQLRNSFNLSLKENQYLSSVENVKITKSEYRPQLGIKARYTEYDINKDVDDSDIRGGLYLTFPIFDFGRGRAKIQASQARSDAAKIEIDIERKSDKVSENSILSMIESSNKAIEKLKDAFNDTKTQRKIINERIMLTGFSPITLVEASENELSQLQILLETEFTLLSKFYEFHHQNQSLINQFKMAL